MAARHATVTTCYTDPWDPDPGIKVECPHCGIEWGWGRSTPEHHHWAAGQAAEHDRTAHPDPTRVHPGA